MKVSEKKWIRFRIYLVAVFFLCGLGTLLVRAYQLQVLEREKLVSIAIAGIKDRIPLPPKRGTIYDREEHELAVSVEVGSIYAHPKQVEKKAHTAKQLARILDTKRGTILNLLKRNRPFVWIKRKVSPEKVARVKALRLQGIGVTRESRRYYPGREIAGHLVGFVGDDNQGLEGLEKKYDGLLRGPQINLMQMRDALGRPFYVNMPSMEEDKMHSLVLTIDKDIQYRAEQALNMAVKKAKAKAGHCIVVNPETGEILAMAVAPLFNPNVFRKHKPAQWRNRIVTDCYEPGSTIKAFLLAAALEKHVVSPQTNFYCEDGAFEVGNRTIHDTKKHGMMSVSEIVTLSSNIGAVKIGQKLGYERFTEFLKRFGFGTRTGIDLLGETSGFIRPPEDTRPIDRATSFFGHGMSASSLQVTMAMAAIANGGKLMRPYVVKEIRNYRGHVVRSFHPKVVRRVLSKRTAKKVALILEGVVSEKGTAPLAAIAGYRVAGKTGTSHKVDPRTRRYSRRDYIASFVGFAPVEQPKLVMMVSVDEPRGSYYGGSVAGPVFKEVGAWTLNVLRVNPQNRLVKENDGLAEIRASLWKGAPVAKEEVEDESLVPDFSGKTMREVLKKARVLGLKIALKGTGLACRQTPRPGVPLEKAGEVSVTFSPPM